MPSLNFDAAPVWLQWVIAVVVIVGFIAGCLKGIPPAWRFLTGFVTTVNALNELPKELKELRAFRKDTTETLDDQNTKIDEIHHEVHFNDGSSVKDATFRIELGVKGLYDQVDELKQADADLRSDLDKTQPKENLQ